jgi:hypothetical protein
MQAAPGGRAQIPIVRERPMSLSMYQASVPVFIRGLKVLSTLLEKGEAHAKEQGLDPAELIDARLAPDMLTLGSQVQRVSDTSKLSGERLSGVPSPKMADEETTFAELQDRVAKTIAYLETLTPEQLEAGQDRTVTLKFGPNTEQVFTAADYLLGFALPNFYFHLVTAHDILRHKGVAVGKRDYLGAA